ncbi:unnamed protein product [Prunus armeniaca]|uniref:Uncharacterized protein n=1 Tax=Prunus armeniaca TaxID=36596 RepID=A0A6J5W4A4_PRUAR|nr:unnamed protein product [Prunus armeniaca]CAB4294687.1 unnamed protein product [Prunus armeniaca]
MCIFAVFSFHNNGYRRYDVIRRCEQVKGVTNVKISDTYGSNAGNIYGCKVGGIYGSKVVREREGLQEVRVEGKFLLKKLKSSLGSKSPDGDGDGDSPKPIKRGWIRGRGRGWRAGTGMILLYPAPTRPVAIPSHAQMTMLARGGLGIR